MNEVKAIVLCNNSIALPSIKSLIFHNKISAVVVPSTNDELLHIIPQIVRGTNVLFIQVNKTDYQEKIEAAIHETGASVGFIMTFPYILPKEIFNLPKNGFINFHYGLLPQCAGPNPILWHMLHNNEACGITLHQVDEGIDTGPIILQEKITIPLFATFGMLQNQLAMLGEQCTSNLLKILAYSSNIPAVQQDVTQRKYYPKPTAIDVTINWNTMNAAAIIRMVNACNPWNKAAATSIKNWMIGITEATLININAKETDAPGTIIAINETDGLLVKTMDNKVLKINIVYTQEGFMSGHKLALFGISASTTFN